MRRTICMVFLCLAGVLLNIVLNRFFGGAVLPLYLDTVFTISLTLYGGLFWGILCGVLTNLIGHTMWFWGWEGYLFVLCNIATAVVTFVFIRFFPRELSFVQPQTAQQTAVFQSRRLGAVMERVVVLILLSFALCITMSVLGGIVSAVIQMLNYSLTGNAGFYSPLGTTMFNQNFPVVLAEILSRIPVNIIDRLVSVFAGYGIALGVSALILWTRPPGTGQLHW